mmetsp:Transcript_32636/g.32346  ORF Transcript_32636/g.32346 Transcript_32636/m.32346 type:complete len:258 (-) Transcript_32636:169-942(-)
MNLGEISKCLRFVLVETSAKAQFPFVKIPINKRGDHQIVLSANKTLKDIKDELISSANAQEVTFHGMDGSKLSLGTIATQAIRDPLFLKIDGMQNYGIFNMETHKTFLTPSQRGLVDSFKLSNSLSQHEAEILGCFNDYILKEIELSKEKIISYDYFLSLSKLSILQFLNQQRIQREYIQSQIHFLRSTYSYELSQKHILEEKAQWTSNKLARRFAYTLLSQYAAVQYGTYWLYSWDIMEPITCLMSMGDLCIGYAF